MLKRGITDYTDEMLGEIQQAVKDTAYAAYASIVSDAQSKLNTTRKDYLSALKFITLQKDNYLIFLDSGFANEIEDGWSPFDMKNKLLSSKKNVSEGPRAGLPWVQKGKAGQRYAHVPFEHSVGRGTKGASDLSGIIKNLKTMNSKTGLQQKMTSVFKDASGKVMQGKVASYRSSKADQEKGLSIPNLEGITKYQKLYKDKNGKEKVKSLYLTFRTVSDRSPSGKWQNKGYNGLHAFAEAEKYVEAQLQVILDTILK